MSIQIQIRKLADSQLRADPVFSTAAAILDDIRVRAYELFSQRGFVDGHAMEDWLRAEREFGWPAAEFSEDERSCLLRVAVPGFTAEQIKVTVNPQEIIVSAAMERKDSDKSRKRETVKWSEFRSDEICRRVELQNAIDINQVSATLQDGMLTVKAARQARPEPRAVPVSAAA